MPKNIVLCSDGTGNSGGKGNNTNVWRIYLAVDHQPANEGPQVAFYDDGVGSQDFKLLKIIGGAFGWGISENLCQLYAFLMLHYEPGDRIYLFGFSRGAFTIRTLGNMIRYCGVAQCDGMSVNGINQRAADALYAYKHRKPNYRDATQKATGGPALEKFKDEFGHYCDDTKTTKDVPIHFIGVWDTVEALGLPIDEMKHGLDWFFGLQFHEGETDLHPGIKNAYHALAIDDERLTFHPVLFDEKLKVEGQVVEQVWFPGMHANVGGGYPKDQLSFVPLTWIMEKADACGLRFHASIFKEFERDRDVDGEMYDSRAGVNKYYRYAPRDIQKISDAAHVKVRKIHASVLQRIYNASDDYAPKGLPKDFQVEPPHVAQEEKNKDERHKQLKIVRDMVWWRRVLHYVFMLWTVLLVGFCLKYQPEDSDAKIPDYGAWDAAERGLYYCVNPILDLLGACTPAFLAPELNALRFHPWAFLGFVLALGLIFWFNLFLAKWTRALSVHAWHMSLAMHKPEKKAEVTRRTWWIRIAHWFRHKPFWVALDLATQWFVRWVAPKVTLAAVFGGLPLLLAALITAWVSLSWNPAETRMVDVYDKGKTDFVFDSKNSMQATPAILQAYSDYRITVEPLDVWSDGPLPDGLPAGPDGLKGEPKWYMKLGRWTRRDPSVKWYTLMGVVDTEPDSIYAIGNGRKIRPEKTGRLFLFVNDTLGCYRNNQGTAKIVVEWVPAGK